MYKRVWFCLLMVLTVSGLIFTVSCAKKIEPGTVTDSGASLDADKQTTDDKTRDLDEKRRLAKDEAAKKAKEEADRAARERRDRDEIGIKERFIKNDIYFEYDESTISKVDQQDALKEKAEFLRDHADINVVIEGHCDERGSAEYNLALGERRAEEAKRYLVDLGISPMRMRTVTYGEERPIESTHTEEAYSKNRRAHFEIE